MSDVWSPRFEYEHREDGAIIMRQHGTLPPHPQTIAAALDHWAMAAPDRTWLARRDKAGDWQRITYAQALTAVRAMGGALLGLGLGPDRPLLIISENSLEHGLIGMACAYVGIPFAPVSPAYALAATDHAKLRGIAATLGPGAIFADDGAAFAPALAAIAAPGRAIISTRNVAPGSIHYDSLMQGDSAAAAAARATITGDTVLKYLFTSGSTGAPKAVINTNGMICASQAMIADCYRFLARRPPVILDWAPWNHTAAGNKVFYMVLTNGGTYYIDDGRPTPGKFGETLRNLRELSCTWYFNVPIGYDLLADALETDAALADRFFADLGMLFYAGAGMAQRTWDRLATLGRRATGRAVLLATGLGSTETSPFALACTEVQDRAGNVGVPALGLILKLVPAGDKLEARLKGPTITPGYYGDPAKTAEAFDEEGFFRLGDALRPVEAADLSRGFFFDGRLAENFKLGTGTWVAVGAVRASIVDALGGLARDAVIVGENAPELGALIWLSDAAQAMTPADLNAALVQRIAAAAGATTGSAARIVRAALLPEPPSQERGEITEKGSLNQRALRARHEQLIARMFAGDVPGMIRL